MSQTCLDLLKVGIEIIISACALVVSFLVYRVYQKQTFIQQNMYELVGKQMDIQEKELEYLDKQLILQKQNFEPKFMVTTELAKVNNAHIYDTQYLYIDNQGYYINSYKSKISTFYIFSDTNTTPHTDSVIPVSGYYACGSKAGNGNNQKGRLETRFDFNNNLHFFNLYKEVTDSNIFRNLSHYTLIEIAYVNYENVAETIHFCVEGTSSFQIPAEDYYTKLNLAEGKTPLEYSTLNLNIITAI